MSNLNRPWRSGLQVTFREEVERIKRLPLNQKNAPLLIGTAMGKKGNFELAWDMDRKTIFVWATTGTWEYVLTKIVKYDSTNSNYYIVDGKKNDFLEKVK
ncbi:MAG TPA: hypothetical protein VL134_12420, partial [Leptolyngbya sp.]|nr:hypothetical protein [Leptolyngbya sp.]